MTGYFLKCSALLLLAGCAAPTNTLKATPLRIMPLGDSLTRGLISPAPGVIPGGYRTRLYDRLSSELYPVDFVGSASDNPDPGNLPDADHEGHGGYRIDQIALGISGWLTAATPDVVLMHLGTNDVAQDFQLSTAPGRLDSLIGQITSQLPNTHVIVAQIISSTSAGERTQIDAYNAEIPGIVAARVAMGQKVSLLDMNSVIPQGDFVDTYHPGISGYDKMADAWLVAIDSLDSNSVAAVPEPSSVSLALLGLLIALASGRRERSRLAT